MTALNELIEIIKQKRNESDISNTLLRFVQIEAEKLLELEKEQQDEFAVDFAKWLLNERTGFNRETETKKLLEIYKKII